MESLDWATMDSSAAIQHHEGTALVVGLHDFSRSLRSARSQGEEARFLALVQTIASDAIRCAEAMAGHQPERVFVEGSGKRVVIVFLEQGLHAESAYTTGLLLCRRLTRPIQEAEHRAYASPQDCFGIGVESGAVEVLHMQGEHLGFSASLGHAVDIAGHLQKQTKLQARTPMIYGSHTNDLLCSRLSPGFVYSDLMKRAVDPKESAPRAGLFATMDSMNAQLRVRFLNQLYLDGLDRSVAAFRHSPSLARDRQGVFELVEHLFVSDPARTEAFRELFV